MPFIVLTAQFFHGIFTIRESTEGIVRLCHAPFPTETEPGTGMCIKVFRPDHVPVFICIKDTIIGICRFCMGIRGCRGPVRTVLIRHNDMGFTGCQVRHFEGNALHAGI